LSAFDHIALDDPAVLDDLALALPADVTAPMLAAFADDVVRRRDDLIAAAAAGDAAAAGREAHSLKGAALNLGFLRLGAAAAHMQELGKAGDLAGVKAASADFSAVCSLSLQRLEQTAATRGLPSSKIRL
jgi:HPt (histidine-containing phosphotransfer) domain-containing protein